MQLNQADITKKAFEIVEEYEKSLGRNVINRQGDGVGYDILSHKGKKKRKDIRTIEVKGTTKRGLFPGFYGSEFDVNRNLIATHLYLVCFYEYKPSLYIIPRGKIKPEWVKKTTTYRIEKGIAKKALICEENKVI